MNIVIMAGGTGSIALQQGLYGLLDQHLDGIDTKVIVNAYDNGLSTGAVRQVMGGRILGPSDVRKNQTTRLALEQPTSPWLDFLNIRFTCETSQAREYCLTQIATLESKLRESNVTELRLAVEAFFGAPMASKIDYSDFALANIIYAGIARQHKYSLRAAASVMAKLVGIKDNVLLNDDTSLFLGAITQSGRRITDEGDIVSWGSTTDPFVDVFFTDERGHAAQPVLCDEARGAIEAADLIILSAGTQWSSLIPTYESVGFRDAVRNSKGRVVLVLNRQPDKDSPGQSASDIVDILTERYFDAGRLHIIQDSTGHPQMRNIQPDDSTYGSVTTTDLSPARASSPKTHCPNRLAARILTTLFQEYLDSAAFVFDYDDTLIGRGNAQPRASDENRQAILQLRKLKPVSICTGNSIKAIQLHGDGRVNAYNVPVADYIDVYADGGINLYAYPVNRTVDGETTQPNLVRCVDPDARIPSMISRTLISRFVEAGIPAHKIENRGDATISIKPIDPEYRAPIASLVTLLIEQPSMIVRCTGRTTIDIHKRSLTKVAAVKDVLRQHSTVTYVGDEFNGGNDLPVKGIPGVRALHVSGPAHTAMFLLALLLHLKEGQ